MNGNDFVLIETNGEERDEGRREIVDFLFLSIIFIFNRREVVSLLVSIYECTLVCIQIFSALFYYV